MDLKKLFKHVDLDSSWPFQKYVVGHAGMIRAAEKQNGLPAEMVREAAMKEVERFMRAGARIAREFGLDPIEVLKVARKQIEREIPGAKGKLKMMDVKIVSEHVVTAEALKAQMLSFGKKAAGN